MNKASILKDVQYNDHIPALSVLMESHFTKEIRIVFRENQILKEHKTTFPIVVEVVEGAIDFGALGEIHKLKKGDLISLSANTPHDLKAHADSIVRLSISKTAELNQ